MKKRYLSVATVAALLCSFSLSSCIGSFRLTNSVIKWNNQVGSKFLNEVVFFAFWVLPVYEVTSLADLLVLNSIEFWSGRNPMTAGTRIVEVQDATYLIASDENGYTVTNRNTSESYRLDYIRETDSWALNVDGELHPFLTFVDDNRVKVISPDGDFKVVELTESGVAEYRNEIMGNNILPEKLMMALN